MEIPERLKRKEFRFIAVGTDKRPVHKDWQNTNNFTYDHPKFNEWINKGNNYGVVGGYGNLIIIDFDHPWAYNRMKDLLPKTFVVKTGGKSLHYYYFIDEPTSFNIHFDTGDVDEEGKKIKKTLIDFQGVGKQVVGAGSLHQTGNRYTIHKDEPITHINIEFLTNLIKDKFPESMWPSFIKRIERTNKKEDTIIEDIKRIVKITEYSGLPIGTQCCPFHSDKTPSFNIFNNGEAFFCFTSSCNVGGSIFDFVMAKEGCDFVGALDILKKYIGYEDKKNPISKPEEEKAIMNHDFFSPRPLEQMFLEGIPEVRYIIKDFLPERGIVFFGGSSGSYKTWAGMQLALAVSTGDKLFGAFPCKKSTVLYIDEENGEITLFNRFKLLSNGHRYERPFDNLHVVNFAGIKFDDKTHIKILDNYIEEHNIKVIVIDSMVRCMKGQEDKADDVRKVYDNLKLMLRTRKELAIVILHHTRKGTQGKPARGMDALRGSGDFAAFSDAVCIFTPYHKAKRVEVEIPKHRHIDLSQFNRMDFRISNPDEKSIRLDYECNNANENSSTANQCFVAMMDYIADEQKLQVRTGQNSPMFKAMVKKDFTKHHCYEARDKLVREGILKLVQRGLYEVIFDEEIKEEMITDE